MKNILAILFVFFGHSSINAQSRLYSNDAKISFYSKTAMENIEAENKRALCIWDTATGKLEFSVLIKGFEFDRALMQEHFNENYMESETYPKAKFKGKIDQPGKIVFTKDGVYPVTVTGQLEMHGVTKTITVPATIAVKGGALSAKSKITVALADYGIEVPKVVKENSSEKVTIEIAADYQIMGAVQ